MDYLNDHSTAQRKSISNSAKFLIAATGGVGIGLTVVCASFVAPAFRRICLPYVPATNEQVRNVLNFLPKNSQSKLLDIGSGDGRIVVAAAKNGINADGVELNPWLVWYSRLSALRQGVHNKTHFYRRDLWKYSVAPYEYVVIFGVEQMMQDLETKLIAESSINAKIIACRFPLPNLQPQRIIDEGVNTVWFYDLDKAKSANEKI
ncbi:ATP synthase subunit C lysine N-methyltransferase [Zeugodacus cucurbitae]|uniref:ATP synthase subunit C lysine N-methyltransferase n=1 Tax=Zeugodacus cucurbitae TaxID=28588 RepID=UPI0023D9668D|nr:ATP synthase subunit C lysine N-methyltransferase [Zeugodacus cucurbitae]